MKLHEDIVQVLEGKLSNKHDPKNDIRVTKIPFNRQLAVKMALDTFCVGLLTYLDEDDDLMNDVRDKLFTKFVSSPYFSPPYDSDEQDRVMNAFGEAKGIIERSIKMTKAKGR